MLDGQATDALEASALGFKGDHIDIYINCWGPKDDGKTFGKPGPMAAKALRLGAEKVLLIIYCLYYMFRFGLDLKFRVRINRLICRWFEVTFIYRHTFPQP